MSLCLVVSRACGLSATAREHTRRTGETPPIPYNCRARRTFDPAHLPCRLRPGLRVANRPLVRRPGLLFHFPGPRV